MSQIADQTVNEDAHHTVVHLPSNLVSNKLYHWIVAQLLQYTIIVVTLQRPSALPNRSLSVVRITHILS
jgi:hypothetical protein